MVNRKQGRSLGAQGFCRLAVMLLLLPFLLGLPVGAAEADASAASSTPQASPVVVIPVHQSVESGLQAFLERAFREAEEMNAHTIILDLDTFGGRVDSAQAIGELVKNSPVPTIAYVRGKALSAGSYIALNAGKIAMEPGSSMGAAAVVDGAGNEIENIKIISAWSGLMKGAAELRGRSPAIAEAMVDKNAGVDLPQIGRSVPKGQILTLTADEAVKVGYAEAVAADLDSVAALMGGSGHPLVNLEPSLAERVARFVTEPWIASLLLMVGIAGILIELFVPGFGVPGLLGLLGFGLYFFGHYIAGFAGFEEMALFAAGILLLVAEIFVSSFGILGLLGAAALVSGVVMAAYNTRQAVWNLGAASIVALVVAGVVIWIFRRRGVWNRFILSERLTTEQGYVSANRREDLLGATGRSLTSLRPSGTAQFGEERVDVVTQGEFMPAGSLLIVTQVEGARVVVKEHREAQNNRL
ncbi:MULTISPECIES: NfeD family protein [Paenibacillus]|uniref:NfeD family protein n=1 Tax=Paenibacillus TaxID=44249 RepID=UPI0022B85A02|nr:NfeD family protein [Paenibacillus caseinilyticus]MCZ8518715.1 nodulation protein NfeD [Paenibacillus caseinilyticus]